MAVALWCGAKVLHVSSCSAVRWTSQPMYYVLYVQSRRCARCCDDAPGRCHRSPADVSVPPAACRRRCGRRTVADGRGRRRHAATPVAGRTETMPERPGGRRSDRPAPAADGDVWPTTTTPRRLMRQESRRLATRWWWAVSSPPKRNASTTWRRLTSPANCCWSINRVLQTQQTTACCQMPTYKQFYF